MRAGSIHTYWLLLVLLYGYPLYGATLNITAEYNPATYEAGGAKFINTTPCTQFPNAPGFWCSATATVDTPQAVHFKVSTRRTVKIGGDIRDGVHYIGFPGARDVILQKDGGGPSFKMKFIVTAVGVATEVDLPSNSNIPDYGDCSDSAIWSNNTSIFLFRDIKAHKQLIGGRCYGNNKIYGDKDINIYTAYLGYRLEAPNPLRLENGGYSGQVTFSIGGGKDFDFGSGYYGDTQLTVSFKVKVRHQIKVEFLSGGNKALLQPPEGWLDWIHNGKNAPTLLQHRLPFRLWHSAPFTLALRCQYPWKTECALRDGKGRTVPLKTYYLHPNNTMELLTTDKIKFALSANAAPVVNGARAIQFQIDGGVVTEMMKYPGSRFTGDVTLIFDVAID